MKEIEYEILEWNSVIPEGKTFPMPMVYVKQDDFLLQWMEKNKNKGHINVFGSGMYDFQKGVDIAGSNSLVFPNYRPNFYNKNKYYTIVLLTPWLGYPPNKGKFILQSMDDVPPPVETVMPIAEWFTQKGDQEKKKKSYILYIVLVSILLLILLFLTIR